jgi:hypothetical protein
MTKILVTSSPAKPNQILRGQSYMANLLTKLIGRNLNLAQSSLVLHMGLAQQRSLF